MTLYSRLFQAANRFGIQNVSRFSTPGFPSVSLALMYHMCAYATGSWRVLRSRLPALGSGEDAAAAAQPGNQNR